jgi:glucose-1-phosphate adenylyltransferase
MIMGCDYYESDSQRRAIIEAGGVPMGIGSGSTLRNVIVDKNARIGDNVQIINK